MAAFSVVEKLVLLLLISCFSLAQSSAQTSELLFEDVPEFQYARTLADFNATTVLYGIAVGAVLVLFVGVGLYFYDYYGNTSRTEPIPDRDYAQYYQQQNQNSERAYPVYRYVTNICTTFIVAHA